MSSNTLFNTQNIKSNNLKGNNLKGNNLKDLQNSKVLMYAIIILISIVILVGLLFLFGFRIEKCREKARRINNDNIINNQQRLVRQINNNNNNNVINSVNNLDGERLRERKRRARDRREELRGGIPIPHREGLEERMRRPDLYRHGNPFQYPEQVKIFYDDYN